MGDRSRKDPAGHARRAKGQPTPPAPQNGQPVQQTGPPPARIVAWIVGAQAEIAKHPALEGEILSLNFAFPGGVVTVKMPLTGGWDACCDVVATAKADYERGSRIARVVLPPSGGVDLKAEAEAHRKLREGPDHA